MSRKKERLIKEKIIQQAIKNTIECEERMGLPTHEAWEVIEYDFDRVFDSVWELGEEIGWDVYDVPFLEESKLKMKEYALNIFDDVLEDYEKNK